MQEYLSRLRERNIVVIGYGVTGVASAEFLCKHGVAFSWVDSRETPAALTDAKALRDKYSSLVLLHWGADWQLSLQGADFVIASPGMPLTQIQPYCRNAEITSDIAVFMQCITQPVIAITGSNGKSTVTKLVAYLLNSAGIKAQIGGNIGVPVLSVIDNNFDVAVLELSSFQLEITPPLAYRSAVFLNVSEDHMDRYDCFDDYVNAKQRIFPKAELAVYNALEQQTAPMAVSHLTKTVAFEPDCVQRNDLSVGVTAYCNGEALIVNEEVICDVSDLLIAGQHNIANALAALLLVSPWCLDKEVLRDALRRFEGLPHRCQVVPSRDGVRWINDSKATNVGATVAALKGLKPSMQGELHLLLGGDGKSADFSSLSAAAYQFADSVVCYGQDAAEIELALHNKVIRRVTSFDNALRYVAEQAKAGDTVLLSPACASFDEFESFAARGNAFMEFVRSREIR